MVLYAILKRGALFADLASRVSSHDVGDIATCGDTVLQMCDDYFRPLTATMLNFAYFSPIFRAV